jgi:hypothetical protein
MNRPLYSLNLLLISLLCFTCQSPDGGGQQDMPAQQEQEWQTIFNGNDLEGWTAVGSAAADVENGELVLTRSGDTDGWLVSNARPANFLLKAEFMLNPAGNSGLAVRYPADAGGDPALSGYEINLDNRPDIQNPTGSVLFLARAFWNEAIDPTGWNELQVKAEGDHILVSVNGKEVAETFARRSMQGAIALQAPAGGDQPEVRFRNIELKTLPPSSFTKPMIADYMRSTPKRDRTFIFNGDNFEGWHVRGDAQWTVSEGVITGDSEGTEGGFLCTEKTYKNFYLRLKFKIALEDNSGVFIRHDPDAEDVTLDNALEINVYDVTDLNWAHPTGSINTHARAFMGMISYDDWNLMEIFAFDEQVTTYVNGMKAAEGRVPEIYQNAGEICLQVYPRMATDNGPSKVMYKDIAIKNLEGIPAIGY